MKGEVRMVLRGEEIFEVGAAQVRGGLIHRCIGSLECKADR